MDPWALLEARKSVLMNTSYDFLRLTVKGLQILWLMGHEDSLSYPPLPLTEEESRIRDVEQNATDHKATLADISYQKPRRCGPGLPAGLEAMGTSSVLAGCPVARWLVGCNSIIFSLDISLASLLPTHSSRRTSILLP